MTKLPNRISLTMNCIAFQYVQDRLCSCACQTCRPKHPSTRWRSSVDPVFVVIRNAVL